MRRLRIRVDDDADADDADDDADDDTDDADDTRPSSPTPTRNRSPPAFTALSRVALSRITHTTDPSSIHPSIV